MTEQAIGPELAPTRNPENLREIERDVASVVIISSDGKILLGRKDPRRGGVYPDAWHIPGGGVNDGESLQDAAVREASEEVGLDLSETALTPLPFVGRGETVKTLETGEQVWVIMNFNRFEVRLGQPAAEIPVQARTDLVEARWFAPEELAEVEQIPGGREFFIAAGYVKNP